MADIKISELPTGSASDTDVIPVVDGGFWNIHKADQVMVIKNISQ